MFKLKHHKPLKRVMPACHLHITLKSYITKKATGRSYCTSMHWPQRSFGVIGKSGSNSFKDVFELAAAVQESTGNTDRFSALNR
jgi:hypothetical protein